MTKRILCIDGGGIKGIFPASFLATVEDGINGHVVDYFDLIAGVSTGGILALGLGLGIPAKDLLEFYEKQGPKIFSGNRLTLPIRSLFKAKYDHKPLKRVIKDVFGKHKLGESKTRLVIPSTNIETGEVHVFKTAHHTRFKMDYKIPMAEVALATSAAPSFFPIYSRSREVRHIDGGIWANNPIAVAAVEAMAILDWTRPIEILSLSCTSSPLSIYPGKYVGLGEIYWCTRITDLFMTMQSQSALGMAQLLIGNENILRINPIVPNKKFKLDGIKRINSLVGIGRIEARKALPELEKRFFHQATERFAPEHKLEYPRLNDGMGLRD